MSMLVKPPVQPLPLPLPVPVPLPLPPLLPVLPLPLRPKPFCVSDLCWPRVKRRVVCSLGFNVASLRRRSLSSRRVAGG